jgi:hypothetical protein
MTPTLGASELSSVISNLSCAVAFQLRDEVNDESPPCEGDE